MTQERDSPNGFSSPPNLEITNLLHLHLIFLSVIGLRIELKCLIDRHPRKKMVMMINQYGLKKERKKKWKLAWGDPKIIN